MRAKAKTNVKKVKKNSLYKVNAVIGRYIKPLKSLGYKVIDQLGRGSEGVVFLVLNERTGKQVAIKVCDRRRCPKNAIGEFWLWAQVDHPNCLRIQEKCSYRNLVYYVMAYTPNLTVLDWIQEAWFTPAVEITEDNKPHEVLLKKWCRQILAGVQYLHCKNFYHLDLKPDNVFLDENWNVKIGDFGFMRTGDDMSEPLMLGCPAYMPPEGLISIVTPGVDLSKVDIWSTGVTIFEMITGKLLSGKDFKICAQRRTILLQNLQMNHPRVIKMRTLYPGGHDLVKHLIKWNADDRVSATEALQHPWLRLRNGDFEMTGSKDDHCCKAHSSSMFHHFVSAAANRFGCFDRRGDLPTNVTEMKTTHNDANNSMNLLDDGKPRNKLIRKKPCTRVSKQQSRPTESPPPPRKRKLNDDESNERLVKRFRPENYKNFE